MCSSDLVSVLVLDVGLELLVRLVLTRLAAGDLQPQPVPDEGVEIGLALAPEGELDGPPVVVVERRLPVARKRHQDEVADEVDGREGPALGVHRLEYELGVVL